MTSSTGRQIVFIHGLWLHASSWQPWMDLFSEWGYDPIAPGWPGEPDTVEEARANPDAVANLGIDDVTNHYAEIIDGLDRPPILIGHSFGGMIAEKLLGQDKAEAVVAIDAAQIKGVLPVPLTALKVTLPVFKNPANRHKSVALTSEQFRYGFGNAVSPEESDKLWEQWAIPSPGKPLFEAAVSNFVPNSPAKVDTHNEGRGPLLLMMGGEDHTVPEAITKATLKQYRHSLAETDLMEFADRGHSLVIDSGWREIATASLSWLQAHQL
jgi:pimeloyl-ACP methyl ester carboxylesterase